MDLDELKKNCSFRLTVRSGRDLEGEMGFLYRKTRGRSTVGAVVLKLRPSLVSGHELCLGRPDLNFYSGAYCRFTH